MKDWKNYYQPPNWGEEDFAEFPNPDQEVFLSEFADGTINWELGFSKTKTKKYSHSCKLHKALSKASLFDFFIYERDGYCIPSND